MELRPAVVYLQPVCLHTLRHWIPIGRDLKMRSHMARHTTVLEDRDMEDRLDKLEDGEDRQVPLLGLLQGKQQRKRH